MLGTLFPFRKIYWVSLQATLHSLGLPYLVALHRSHTHLPCQNRLGRPEYTVCSEFHYVLGMHATHRITVLH